MIANTVIVFLRDLLPVFILFCYLTTIYSSARHNKLKVTSVYSKIALNNWLQSLLTGLIFTFLLFFSSESISDCFEGKGLEITHVILICVSCASFVAIPIMDKLSKHKFAMIWVLCIGSGAFMSLKGTEFIFYFGVHIQQEGQFLNILIGCILGLGICSSFSILLRFFLIELASSNYAWLVLFLWYSFIAGLFSQITTLLSQVDLLDIGPPIFDSSSFIEDSSEYGYILHALFGYESSPNPQWLVTYAIGFIIAFVIQLIVNTVTKTKAIDNV